MATVYNRDYNLNEEKLFLGDELGVADYVNVKYQVLEDLALKQRSQMWYENEISLEKDKAQWPTLPEHIKDITRLNLGWQTIADSLITRAPETAISQLVSRPELEGLLIQWSYFENLHSRAYSNIIRNVLTDPSEFIESVNKNEHAFARVANSIGILDELAEKGLYWTFVRDNPKDYPDTELEEVEAELRVLLCKVYFAIYALESIMFYASFACTFALAEQDILPGVAKSLQLIAKDEALHTVASREILNILKTQVTPKEWAEAEAAAPEIMASVLDTEINWAKFIFSEGRKIIGLNSTNLPEYLYFIARNSFAGVGIAWPDNLPVVEKNPILWINKWLDPSSQQVAPQEMQITNYKMGQTKATSDSEIENMSDLIGDL
ncbi:putative ribonucleotide reductase beta subunit [Pectobacterium phage DU_PP_V]|uniref:ribonucleoside-diphosphate reductase n=1 Tax=Pectobacterium phage DU_PP_V TaxID=2041492 RepID=A0A2D2W6Y6_9CAUD|nr:putative ribonucleotide reductase beta subunit [Pectobacterium phage DU_PP_V]ATS94058.1 putative ribonucleotide reductase beta subunit [Pectobacterium phage DU_PP_V]